MAAIFFSPQCGNNISLPGFICYYYIYGHLFVHNGADYRSENDSGCRFKSFETLLYLHRGHFMGQLHLAKKKWIYCLHLFPSLTEQLRKPCHWNFETYFTWQWSIYCLELLRLTNTLSLTKYKQIYFLAYISSYWFCYNDFFLWYCSANASTNLVGDSRCK